MKRRRRRSTRSSTLSLSVPATWLRNPRSRYCGTNSMPDLPSFSDWVTSAALLPIGETTPSPVTTTRRISGPRRGGRVLDQAHFEAVCFVDRTAIGVHDAVGNAHHQPSQDHALQMNVISQFAYRGPHHASEFDLAHAQRPTAPRRLHPAQEEADHLPQRIQRQAAPHHRIALEMAGEEPKVGLHI